jgi:hypothetical protein
MLVGLIWLLVYQCIGEIIDWDAVTDRLLASLPPRGA